MLMCSGEQGWEGQLHAFMGTWCTFLSMIQGHLVRWGMGLAQAWMMAIWRPGQYRTKVGTELAHASSPDLAYFFFKVNPENVRL